MRQQKSSSFWIKALKIAIMDEDLKSIDKLSSSMPNSFTSIDEMEEAKALTKEAMSLLKNEKNKLSQEMTKLKKANRYF